MWPSSTLTTWGNSSIRSRRIQAPTRVTRGSSSFAHTARPSLSAFTRMLRNLIMRNVRPFWPVRSCRYRIGPRSSSQIAAAAASATGAAATRMARLTSTSNARLVARRRKSQRNPLEKMSQLGCISSTLTRPLSRSRKVRISVTRMPRRRHSSSSAVGKPLRRSSMATTISSMRLRNASRTRPLLARNIGPVALRAHIPYDAEAALVGAPAKALADGARPRARAPHQHAALEELLVHHPKEREAGDSEACQRESAGQAHDPTAHVQTWGGIEDQAERDLGDRHGDQQAHEHRCEPPALAQLVQAERGERYDEDCGNRKSARPERPARGFEGGKRGRGTGEADEDR